MRQTPGSASLSDATLGDKIAAGAQAIGIELPHERVRTLVRFIELIERWNRTYNLTAVRDPAEMVTHHVLDCLAAAAALTRRLDGITQQRLLDVGSGAGLPGLVFAAVLPELEITCIDSVGKKAAFVRHAAALLALTRVRALHGRVEELRGEVFDVIASRAFASLPDFMRATRHVLAASGTWMALKGKLPIAELQALSPGSFHVEQLDVPGLCAERCVVWVGHAEK